MIKARILDDGFFGGLYAAEWLLKNNDKTINGALVSNWQLTEFLPSKDLLKPKYTGTEWVEGATSEEINTAQALKDAIQKRQQREELLSQGATVELNGKEYHFTEPELQRFIVLKNEAEKGSLPAIEYPDTTGSWNPLTIAECTQISLSGMGIFQNIYKTTS